MHQTVKYKRTALFQAFFNSEKTGGLLLIICTLFSLLLANSSWAVGYQQLWEFHVNGHSITHWINDGLMAIFFLLIGLELEREVYIGELSSIRSALLPALCALGGVLVPAGIFVLLNAGQPTSSGAGIPMATDIAFAIGILSLFGNRVPHALKVFLTALAVIDDLIAIIVISIFYTEGLSVVYASIAGGIFLLLLLLNRLKVHRLWPYLIGGVALWYTLLHSGIHASIAGVLVAFAIPFSDGSKTSISFKLQQLLHHPVALIILPLFALANTSIPIQSESLQALNTPLGWGIFLGLVFGKPIGIYLTAMLSCRLKWSSLPENLNWKMILGAGMLGGIGFTMSIFIAILAFDQQRMIDLSKLSVLISSLIAGLLGGMLLHLVLPSKKIT
jgi:NhaA family Na+:H+ antiporter